MYVCIAYVKHTKVRCDAHLGSGRLVGPSTFSSFQRGARPTLKVPAIGSTGLLCDPEQASYNPNPSHSRYVLNPVRGI